MRAEQKNKHDVYWSIYDDEGVRICFTRVSHGAKETLRSSRVNEMARQLRLDDSQSLVDLVQCTLNRENALAMMKRNPPNKPYMC